MSKNYVIENEAVKLTVSSHGAEIKSLIRKDDSREIMWQADPEFWGRTSPVLFPLVGNYYEKKSVFAGKTYEMGQHGFARDMEFDCVLNKEDELSFELSDNEDTRKKYPFGFKLTIGYKLLKNMVIVKWKVDNTNSETMYFSIGGHPAFNCDLDTYTLKLMKNNEPLSIVKAGIISSDGSGCLSDEVKEYGIPGGILKMSDELFMRDALIVEDEQADEVALIDDKGNTVLTVKFDMPLFGLWSPTGKHAPFVCIEPWCGRCDRVGFGQKLEEREYGNTLAKGEVFEKEYTIQI
ncbi:MAG: aldose 1-epimerase family protein [Butyrivibrio sp.]|nr:aldose 1-epimerase family protein [Butyrivibrio sp.]